uniref:Putative polyprotein n=1 Tax=Phytophthora infestans TaxID=4787 RepID=Q572H0_PHYIN|nr:putative polyprotein [Phytophthora infestans]
MLKKFQYALLRDEIRTAYEFDPVYSSILEHLRSPSEKTLSALSRSTRHQIDRYRIEDGLLTYSLDRFDASRVVVPNDPDLRSRIIHESHDIPLGAHLGREKKFAAVSRDFYWPHMYKWVRKWVRTCEICQRVKPSASSQAPLRPLPVATEAWRSVSMDFVFGLPPDSAGRSGVLVFIDRFSKMVHLIPVPDTITVADTAVHFVDAVFRHHGMPESIVSDRDPRFTSAFWTKLFELSGTKLLMSTAAHPETDGQTERVNRPSAPTPVMDPQPVSIPVADSSSSAASSSATDNAVTHAQARKALTTPRDAVSPLASWTNRALISPGTANAVSPSANYAPKQPAHPADNTAVSDLLLQRQAVTRYVRDALQTAVDKQKENADKRGRKHTVKFATGDRVLLSTSGSRDSAVTNLGASKLAPRFIGPFTAYTLDIPTSLRLHPTFYVGRLKQYLPATIPSSTQFPEPPAHIAAAPPDARAEPSRHSHQAPAPPSRSADYHVPRAQEASRAPRVPDSTDESQSQSSRPLQPRPGPPPPPDTPSRSSPRDLHRGSQPERQSYQRDGPPPIVDSAGEIRWIVEKIVDHEDPPRRSGQCHASTSRTAPAARRYRIRWLGFPADQDTWEPRTNLLRDVPDVIQEYDSSPPAPESAANNHAAAENEISSLHDHANVIENDAAGDRASATENDDPSSRNSNGAAEMRFVEMSVGASRRD